jgi:predicted aminopeptidase
VNRTVLWMKRRPGTTLCAGIAAALFGTVGATGCTTFAYYGQAAAGHLSMLSDARPVDQLLADGQTPERLKQRLERARQMRAFASSELGLPDNRSYTEYADLKRPSVVWNVFATPELSLTLKNWCYPMFGCAGYRGYFDKAKADALAAELRALGYDVNVTGVPAYSTLGWMNWAGGDPLLNTFIHWPDPELARLIFHELAHQVLYVKDDTVFNESFATAVERAGVTRWLARHGDETQRAGWAAYERRRADFLALLLEHRKLLEAIYASNAPEADQRAGKREVFARLRAEYERAKRERWDGFAGYDRFFAQDLNGAHLAAVAAYNDLVPAFEALLARVDGDLPRFFAEVKSLGELPRPQRDARLALR